MSGREWKPGDVVLVSSDTDELSRAVRRGGVWHFLDREGYGIDAYVTPIRPLVVIDPESREQVERFALVYDQEYEKLHPEAYSDSPILIAADDDDLMQSALREFANPTPPKPEEPTGLGAVVEDEDGVLWVRNEYVTHPWHSNGHGVNTWKFITAVRVHSEGVTP